jgi:uncharacterized membrane protein
MKKLTRNGQKWLKFFHILFAGTWVGAGLCLNLMIIFLEGKDDRMLYGILVSMKFIDDFVIIPCAMMTLLTGVLYSMLTNWGWFKFKWITVKWIITLYGILFGTFFLGPWLNSLPLMADTSGLKALTFPKFIYSTNMLYIFGVFQVFTLIFAILISTLKPWNKKTI